MIAFDQNFIQTEILPSFGKHCPFQVTSSLQNNVFNVIIFMLKITYFNLFSKTTNFFCLWLLNKLLNIGLFNIHKMRASNSHVVFSSKNNFQELQFHQTLSFFFEFHHISRSQHSQQKLVHDFQKMLVLILFVFWCFLKNTL